MKKDCNRCVNKRPTEIVVDGHIEHKTESGEVWMLEPKYKEVPHHCVCNQEAYCKHWEIIKHMTHKEIDAQGLEPDCDMFQPTEISQSLDNALDAARKLLDMLNKE